MNLPTRTTLPVLLLLLLAPAVSAEPDDHFIIRDTDQDREDVVQAILEFVEHEDDWIHLADFPLLGGQLSAVKICYLPIAEDIFAAGMHVGAFMPCAHIALYEEDGMTRVSTLHPKFMTTLQPDPNLERAVEKGVPAFETMLDTVLE
ncbi:DUF302 domain-containing protein [Thioalkalivibrio sp. ALJ24]|uniref:DUF302 domain-containing protein n=1 Tax=Thioalkalivibrio sp. ALJ24 TaxID=545276 RepID=UPI000379231B|nr:DUF302 domain-containing protein [Thioalkalivibrio sp. ALJ24]